MEHRKQHTVPESYLTAWCDPETPEGQEPYVWRWLKDGTEVRRKAPRNIFYEMEIYTLKTPDGSRDLRLEGMLSGLEAAFATNQARKVGPFSSPGFCREVHLDQVCGCSARSE